MPSCDTLIVGGGPAGSTCAWRLATAGRHVVILDAARFPRDKVCAGWVTPQALETLRLDRGDYARGRTLQPFTGFRLGVMGRTPVTVHYGTTVSYGIRRCEFDEYLLRRCGARVFQGEAVRDIRRVAGEWEVNGWRARTLVGAGGHFCPVARMLSRDSHTRPVIAAQEAEFPIDDAHDDARRGDEASDAGNAPGRDRAVRPEMPELHFCEDLAGYAWCVRKGGYVNVGIGRLDAHALSSHMAAFVRMLVGSGRLASCAVPTKGHAYWLYPDSPRPLGAEGVLLVGDAAGLAYAASGEGIRPAIESGILAAETILAGDSDLPGAYARRIEERFGRRTPSRSMPAVLPATLRTAAARRLMGHPWFARRVVLDRHFLHRGEPRL